jgi:hypothetical protein
LDPGSRVPDPGFLFETPFDPRAGVDELRSHLTEQFTIGFAPIADACPQRGRRLRHRELVAKRDHFFQIEVGRDPSGEKRCPARDVGCHAGIAIAIAADPGPEAHR